MNKYADDRSIPKNIVEELVMEKYMYENQKKYLLKDTTISIRDSFVMSLNAEIMIRNKEYQINQLKKKGVKIDQAKYRYMNEYAKMQTANVLRTHEYPFSKEYTPLLPSKFFKKDRFECLLLHKEIVALTLKQYNANLTFNSVEFKKTQDLAEALTLLEKEEQYYLSKGYKGINKDSPLHKYLEKEAENQILLAEYERNIHPILFWAFNRNLFKSRNEFLGYSELKQEPGLDDKDNNKHYGYWSLTHPGL